MFTNISIVPCSWSATTPCSWTAKRTSKTSGVFHQVKISLYLLDYASLQYCHDFVCFKQCIHLIILLSLRTIGCTQLVSQVDWDMFMRKLNMCIYINEYVLRFRNNHSRVPELVSRNEEEQLFHSRELLFQWLIPQV